MKLVFYIALLGVLALSGFVFYSNSQIRGSTGTLVLTASSRQAVLSISQFNKAAQIIGVGSANVRLLPGTYQVAAAASGHTSSMLVTIQKQKTTYQEIGSSAGTGSVNDKTEGLFSKLPVIGPSAEYQIDISAQPTPVGTQYTLVITSGNEQGKLDALTWIRNQGFDPNNYTITYKQQVLTNYHYTEGLPGQ